MNPTVKAGLLPAAIGLVIWLVLSIFVFSKNSVTTVIIGAIVAPLVIFGIFYYIESGKQKPTED